jgi:hypothetical protein
MAMRRLYNDPTTRDSPCVTLQLLLGFISNTGLHCIGAIHVLEGDLERNLHAQLLL